ncbi:hypothetical protein [Nocardioides daphniae]|uniref:hypothetical protein n=1 Tax=Nocardioides daphniae TaxID=402297 RepID=UPI001881F196|nr:hypothetical protein [Nocardioides daphniae]
MLDSAAIAQGEFAVIAVLADAVQARVVSAESLAAALGSRTKLAHRPLVTAVLADLSDGTDSVLEHGYLTRVERPHGLPGAVVRRRSPGCGRTTTSSTSRPRWWWSSTRDFHSLAHDRYADLARDAAAAAAGHLTVRWGWGQVFHTPCETAARMADLLRQRGWVARDVARGAEHDGRFESPGDSNLPVSEEKRQR